MSHIFLSYSHEDKKYAHELAVSLKDRGFEVWIHDQIDYGTQWTREIREHLDHCSAFVVIMTPRSEESAWVQSELAYAMDQRKPILPVLLEGRVWLPVASMQYSDVRNSKLPPERFYTRLAELVAPRRPTTPQPEPNYAPRLSSLEVELHDIERQYQKLTERIAALDRDIELTIDREHKLILQERRQEREVERSAVAAKWSAIEEEISALRQHKPVPPSDDRAPSPPLATAPSSEPPPMPSAGRHRWAAPVSAVSLLTVVVLLAIVITSGHDGTTTNPPATETTLTPEVASFSETYSPTPDYPPNTDIPRSVKPTSTATEVASSTYSPAVLMPSTSQTATPIKTVVPTPTNTATLTRTPAMTMQAAVAAAAGANFRSGPGTIYPVLGRFPFNTKMTIIGRNVDNSWLYLTAPDGHKGWMALDVLDTDIDLANISVVIASPAPTATRTPTWAPTIQATATAVPQLQPTMEPTQPTQVPTPTEPPVPPTVPPPPPTIPPLPSTETPNAVSSDGYTTTWGSPRVSMEIP